MSDLQKYIKNEYKGIQKRVNSFKDNINLGKEITFLESRVKSDDKLQSAEPASIIEAFTNCLGLGLTMNTAASHVHLIIYKGKVKLRIDYRGLVFLLLESSKNIKSVKAEVICENDSYDITEGTESKLYHQIRFPRGKAIAAFAYVRYNDDSIKFEVIDHEELMAVKNKSESKNSNYSPWNDPELYKEMYKKVALRRLIKTLKIVPGKLIDAIEKDNEAYNIKIKEQKEHDFDFSSNKEDIQEAEIVEDKAKTEQAKLNINE